MIQIDVRGLSCPEPVLQTRAALEQSPGEALQVIVSDVNARENVKLLAQRNKKEVEIAQEGQDYFITIK